MTVAAAFDRSTMVIRCASWALRPGEDAPVHTAQVTSTPRGIPREVPARLSKIGEAGEERSAIGEDLAELIECR